MLARTLSLTGPVLLIVGMSTSFSQDTREQTVVAECTSGTTNMKGERNACDSAWSEAVAPTGYVFSKESLQGGEWSGNGSEHNCLVQWDGNVEVIPGSKILQPTILRARAHARSEKGHGAGRGWAKCKYTVTLTKYTR